MKSILKVTFMGLVLGRLPRKRRTPPTGKPCSSNSNVSAATGPTAKAAPEPGSRRIPPRWRSMQKYVRNPTGAMPPYTNQVSDADIADIRAYLATVPAPPAVKDIPLLNQ